MEIDFNTLPNRQNTGCSKWDTYDKHVLPMWVADMDFRSPQPVIDALKARVDHGVFGYSLPPENIKEAVVNWIARRHGWQINEDDLVFIPGVVSGFNLAAHAVTRPGDGYLVQTPTYGPFFRVANNVKLVQHEMELTQVGNGYYEIDLDAFEAALTGRTRIFMLCNPQNPTGRVFDKDELEAMAEICLKNDVIICSDEIHSDLIYSGNKHIPIASLDPQIAVKTITLIAPSKTFNIAGLDASVAIITDKTLRKQFESARQGLLGGVNLLGMVAMEAAYARCVTWLDELLKYLESNRNFLYDFVSSELPGIKTGIPEGTYLAWLDCRELNIDEKPSEFFLNAARVAMNDGEWFGKGGKGYVRLNFGCPQEMLDESLCRMKEAIRRL
jgi:cystathionine beta-lyase